MDTPGMTPSASTVSSDSSYGNGRKKGRVTHKSLYQSCYNHILSILQLKGVVTYAKIIIDVFCHDGNRRGLSHKEIYEIWHNSILRNDPSDIHHDTKRQSIIQQIRSYAYAFGEKGYPCKRKECTLQKLEHVLCRDDTNDKWWINPAVWEQMRDALREDTGRLQIPQPDTDMNDKIMVETIDLDMPHVHELDLSGTLTTTNPAIYTPSQILSIPPTLPRHTHQPPLRTIPLRLTELLTLHYLHTHLSKKALLEAWLDPDETPKAYLTFLTSSTLYEIKLITRWREAVMQVAEYWSELGWEGLRMEVVFVLWKEEHGELVERVRRGVRSVMVRGGGGGLEGVGVRFVRISRVGEGGRDYKVEFVGS
ncbi:hypothetical protein HDV00_011855 [Rhizophlyctis rosea]|nr:hypothetical protein HDV00_011855 [Rhizophlyctis rosea]